jgi:hypothetical protein
MVVLLLILFAIYRTARPLLEHLAWLGLDSAFATTHPERAIQVPIDDSSVTNWSVAATHRAAQATLLPFNHPNVDGTASVSTTLRR